MIPGRDKLKEASENYDDLWRISSRDFSTLKRAGSVGDARQILHSLKLTRFK